MTNDELKRLRIEQRLLDRQVMDYSIKILGPYYAKRRDAVRKIPKFWSSVIGETEPLRPYITYDDSLAFDTLNDFWIEWDLVDSRNVVLSFSFGDNPHFGPQTLTKRFVWREIVSEEGSESGEGFYESDMATCIQLKSGVKLLEQHLQGGEESFFTLFGYTKTDKLADRQENTLIVQTLVDEIFPAAIDLYNELHEDQDIAEEYDISESD